MLLKRRYAIPEGWEPERGPDGQLLNALPVESLSVTHTGTNPEQNFSRRFVDAGIAEGWLSMRKGTLTLHATEEDLVYTITHMPGTYCCHCDAKLDDDPTGTSGRNHLAQQHDGAESPDPSNPSGIRVTNAYECVLDAEQHAQWKVPAYATVSHARWKDEGVTPQKAPAKAKRAAPVRETDGKETDET